MNGRPTARSCWNSTCTIPGVRPGADVVQLYLHDPVAQVTRPVVRLVGFARVSWQPLASARVRFRVPADVSLVHRA